MILVTGATGLVGAHLTLHLIENGATVRAIYRKIESLQKTKAIFDLYKKTNLFAEIQWIEADILDVPSLENAFQDIDFVYHCAAFISFAPKDEDRIRKTNIEGTANIVNFCIAKKIQKLCYISSIAALGDLATNERIVTEKTEWNPEKPHSDYAISKYGAEMEVWRGQQEGLSVIVVNPGVIMGPVKTKNCEQGSSEIYQRVAKGLSFYTLGTTGFITVDDVVKISIQLMESTIKNERYTLIADNIIFQDLLNTIASALQVRKPRIHADATLMQILWKIDWFLATFLGKKRQISKAAAKASYSKTIYSNEKIKTALNYTFRDVHQYIREMAIL